MKFIGEFIPHQLRILQLQTPRVRDHVLFEGRPEVERAGVSSFSFHAPPALSLVLDLHHLLTTQPISAVSAVRVSVRTDTSRRVRRCEAAKRGDRDTR